MSGLGCYAFACSLLLLLFLKLENLNPPLLPILWPCCLRHYGKKDYLITQGDRVHLRQYLLFWHIHTAFIAAHTSRLSVKADRVSFEVFICFSTNVTSPMHLWMSKYGYPFWLLMRFTSSAYNSRRNKFKVVFDWIFSYLFCLCHLIYLY